MCSGLDASAITNPPRASVIVPNRSPATCNKRLVFSSSLTDAQEDFTVEGWAELMKWLNGFIDDKGAPTGSSQFTATGETIVRSSENGVIRLAIPGTLKQQTQNPYGGISTTTYRVLVDVQVGGTPLKIEHLKTTTCGAAPCR